MSTVERMATLAITTAAQKPSTSPKTRHWCALAALGLSRDSKSPRPTKSDVSPVGQCDNQLMISIFQLDVLNPLSSEDSKPN